MTTNLLQIAESPNVVGANGPRLVRVARRGAIFRPSPTLEGVYGLDLTAGCHHGCGYCYIRGSGRFPGEDRILFDPFTADRLDETIDAMEVPPQRVVLSPTSDPLPPLREVRRVAEAVVARLLDRGIGVMVMTRGRFSPALIRTLAAHPDRSRALIGITTLDKALSRRLEPRAASPRGRLRDIARLVGEGVDVEIRLEPLIADLTDTRENLQPLFASLAKAGAKQVMAHSLFLHPAMLDTLEASLNGMERLKDQYEGGPGLRLGSLGMTKHLSPDVRRSNLAKWIAWGAEYGLNVTTGDSQNPDLRRNSH